jgi:hypothetical protein
MYRGHADYWLRSEGTVFYRGPGEYRFGIIGAMYRDNGKKCRNMGTVAGITGTGTRIIESGTQYESRKNLK